MRIKPLKMLKAYTSTTGFDCVKRWHNVLFEKNNKINLLAAITYFKVHVLLPESKIVIVAFGSPLAFIGKFFARFYGIFSMDKFGSHLMS